MRLVLALALASSAWAQWEIGGLLGYGAYHNGSVISPNGTAKAGVRNRFAAGVVIGEDLYDYVSGEFRYLYQDGDPFISMGSLKSNVQGQSHAFHYDVLVHLRDRESRMRPFIAAGLGAKWFVTTQSAPAVQPLEKIASLVSANQTRALVTIGGGVKYDWKPHVRVRVEFRDYITPFPNKIIVPAPGATGRGILHQFTPMVGISGVF